MSKGKIKHKPKEALRQSFTRHWGPQKLHGTLLRQLYLSGVLLHFAGQKALKVILFQLSFACASIPNDLLAARNKRMKW